MDLNCVLNFTEICRCCKRTEPGMTSIFDGNALLIDHTYPPVKEMLRSIASLNVQENDGLPSLVCTSCLNNIQGAFTFILQLIRIDEELSLILATRKQDDTLPAMSQSIFETHPYISTDYMKKENEDVNHSLKVEDMDEPILNFYQHVSVVSSYENIDLAVKLEQLDQDVAGNVDEPAAVESEEISNLADPLYHASDEEKDILVKEYTCTVNEHLNVKDDDNLLMVQKSEEMDDSEDMNDLRVDEEYQVDVEEGNNTTDSSDDTDEVEADEDYQENNEDGNSEDSLDSFRTLRTKRRKTSSNLVDAPLLGCKLCAYTNRSMSNLKRHLQFHIDSTFTCSKCNCTFTRRTRMLGHWRKCNGEISIHAVNAHHGQHRRMALKRMRALTLQEFEDPEKMKEFYTEVQQNDDDDDDADEEIEKTSSKLPMLKCNLCAFTNAYMSNLKRHLLTHSKDKPSFTCTKCKLTFRRNDYMQRHRQKCNGEISKFALNACHVQDRKTVLKRMRALTRQEFEDPEKMKEFCTAVHQNNDDGAADDNYVVKMQEAIDAGGEAETSEPTVFRCKLCTFTHKHMSSFKVHLYTHFKEEKPFACSKCNLTFARHSNMKHHWRSCNGEISMRALIGRARNGGNGSGPKQVLGLILQDLEVPEKMKQLYAVDGVETSKQIFKCKLCTYTSAQLYMLKQHLVSHSNDRSFACSKCTLSFKRKCDMLRHLRTCNGEISRRALSRRQVRSNGEKQEQVALTQQELEDPDKIKELYTEIDLQNNVDNVDNVDIGETSKPTMWKCNMCTYTTARMSDLKRHLLTHSKDMPFACSKCNLPFQRNDYMLRHWRKCDGKMSENALTVRNRGNGRKRPAKKIVPLTLSDLDDELKMKEYYTELEVQNNDDDAKMQRAQDAGDGVEKEETSKLASKRTVLKCTLCAYTSADGRLSDLRRHLQTHSANRPFKCSSCNASFARKDYFNRHLGICKAGIVEQWRQNGGHVRHKEFTSRHVLTLTQKDLEDADIIRTYFTEIGVQNVQNIDDNNEDDDVNVQRAVATGPGEMMEKSKRVNE